MDRRTALKFLSTAPLAAIAAVSAQAQVAPPPDYCGTLQTMNGPNCVISILVASPPGSPKATIDSNVSDSGQFMFRVAIGTAALPEWSFLIIPLEDHERRLIEITIDGHRVFCGPDKQVEAKFNELLGQINRHTRQGADYHCERQQVAVYTAHKS